MPTRGSRFVGLLSMIMTRVLGSEGWEQERSENSRVAATPHRIVILTLSLPKGKDLLSPRGRASALRIGNFPQNRGPLRSRCRRHIRRPSMPGLICEQGEGNGFFCFGRYSELVGKAQRDSERCEFVAQHSHECRIVGAATGDNHFLIASPLWKHETPDCIGDRSSRQRGGGGNHVALVGSSATPEKLLRVGTAKFFTARCFRRRVAEE